MFRENIINNVKYKIKPKIIKYKNKKLVNLITETSKKVSGLITKTGSYE